MNNCNPRCDSLFNLTLTKLCGSIDEEGLQCILKWYPPSVIIQIVWKLLNVNGRKKNFEIKTCLDLDMSSVERGQILAKPSGRILYDMPQISYGKMSKKAHEEFARLQQTRFEDKLNFCDHFDYKLFLRLVGSTTYRTKLFTIFQICVQRKGFQFPKRFALEWLENGLQDSSIGDQTFYRIESGLKIGIFLGDAGWLRESALVLSYVFKVMSIEWVCPDDNLKLTKIIQCLTKLLLVLSNLHDFVEAKMVLCNMLYTINLVEKMENRTLCIAYAYIAVSQFFYVLMEFNESWSWTVKAVNELRESSGEVLKLMVISHAVKVCSVLNKLDIAKKLIDQLHTYDKEIEQNIYVDMLMNEACYSLKADLAKDSISNYYHALDSRRNLFGFYNLYTAIVFVDYAYARYVCDYSSTNYNEAMYSILQGIFIMKTIGLPEDNMLLVNAGRIKALILEEKALDITNRGFIEIGPENRVSGQQVGKMRTEMLKEAENLHLKALDVSLNLVGEKALLTAKSYCNLGRLYQSQQKYKNCEQMHLKAIEIKESILGKDNPEVALSLGHLASLYTYQLHRYTDAEQLYLRSKNIYETTYGHQYTGLLYDFQGLAEVYYGTKNITQHNYYRDKVRSFYTTREIWLNKVHAETNVNCNKNDLSVEKLKCILNDCGGSCEK